MHFSQKPNETYASAYKRLNLHFAGIDESTLIIFNDRNGTIAVTLGKLRAYLLSQVEYD